MGQLHQGKQNIFLTLSKHTSKSFLKGYLLNVFFLFQKLKRRKVTIEKKSGWSKEKKTKVHQFLQLREAHKYMSSDEEVDNGFLSHPYSWESEEWRKIKESLDKKFLETCPPRSKRLLAKRTKGSVKNQEPPNVDPTHSWVINED